MPHIASIPTEIFHNDILVHLKISDLKSLITSSKFIARSLEIPLTDLKFKNFGCPTCDVLDFQFIPGSKKPADEAITKNYEADNSVVAKKFCCFREWPDWKQADERSDLI